MIEIRRAVTICNDEEELLLGAMKFWVILKSQNNPNPVVLVRENSSLPEK